MSTDLKKRETRFWWLLAFLAAMAMYPASFIGAVGLYALGILPKSIFETLNTVYAPALWVWGLLS
ncbi:MAG TPA: hypothetical protein VKU82_10725 [Planctomycetaceae bacterium]|nr:hypothetical protein [Planctomycetaceae bacterium]